MKFNLSTKPAAGQMPTEAMLRQELTALEMLATVNSKNADHLRALAGAMTKAADDLDQSSLAAVNDISAIQEQLRLLQHLRRQEGKD